jgi:hypothetical protein
MKKEFLAVWRGITTQSRMGITKRTPAGTYIQTVPQSGGRKIRLNGRRARQRMKPHPTNFFHS